MDNDLISRSALLADIEDTVVISARNTKSAEMRGIHKVTDRIKTAPAVDAVEVVRCKDCDNLTFIEGPYGTVPCCIMRSLETVNDMDFYCADGERRTK